MKRQKKDVKIEEGIYRTPNGWRLFVRVRGDDWPASRKGELKPKRLADPDHEMGIKELRTERERWRALKQQEANDGKPAVDQRVSSITNDLAIYQGLPQFLAMTTKAREQRVMQLTAFIARLPASDGVAGPDRPRLTIKKREWETVLGVLMQDAAVRRKGKEWANGNVNKWMGSVKAFYNALADPDEAQPNPVRTIKPLKIADPEAMNIDYTHIIRVLRRLQPQHRAHKNKMSWQTEALVWKLAQEGVPNVKLATLARVSETAIRKFLRRGPKDKARETEIIYHALCVQAFSGIRPVQWDGLDAEQAFDAEKRVLKVPASAKRDRAVAKELEAFGVRAVQAAIDAGVFGCPYDRNNANKQWKAAWRAEGLPEPAPYPYQLKHSYLTEAMIATPDVGALMAQSGHKYERSLARYTEAAKQMVRRRVADGFGARLTAALTPKTKKPRGVAGDLVLFEKPVVPQLTPADYQARGGPKRMPVFGR